MMMEISNTKDSWEETTRGNGAGSDGRGSGALGVEWPWRASLRRWHLSLFLKQEQQLVICRPGTENGWSAGFKEKAGRHETREGDRVRTARVHAGGWS